MKSLVALDRLLPVLPDSTREALQTEGFFNGANVPTVKRRQIIVDSEEFAEGERAVLQYISTRDVDRDGDVLVPEGAIIDEFMLAPQVLWAHNYSEPPIGRAESVVADNYGLRAKTVFASTDRADEVWQLIRDGFLSTASVGFIPVARVARGDNDWSSTIEKLNRRWDTDLEAAGARQVITKWSLLEYSIVPVPANINALVTAIAKGLALSDDMKTALGVAIDAGSTDAPRRVVIPLAVKRPRVIEVVQRPDHNGRIAIEVIDQLRGRV